jgi:hypothetical protein
MMDIPDKGWFFDIGQTNFDTKVYYDGKEVKYIKKILIEYDASNKEKIPKVSLEIVMDSDRLLVQDSNIELKLIELSKINDK